MNRLFRRSFDYSKKQMRIKDYEAHSPMFTNRNSNEARRSKIFNDRPFIYGRYPKFLMAYMLGNSLPP